MTADLQIWQRKVVQIGSMKKLCIIFDEIKTHVFLDFKA